jgi:hypothetical protein
VEGFCEHGNEPSGSLKCWEVLEKLHFSAAQERFGSIKTDR